MGQNISNNADKRWNFFEWHKNKPNFMVFLRLFIYALLFGLIIGCWATLGTELKTLEEKNVELTHRVDHLSITVQDMHHDDTVVDTHRQMVGVMSDDVDLSQLVVHLDGHALYLSGSIQVSTGTAVDVEAYLPGLALAANQVLDVYVYGSANTVHRGTIGTLDDRTMLVLPNLDAGDYDVVPVAHFLDGCALLDMSESTPSGVTVSIDVNGIVKYEPSSSSIEADMLVLVGADDKREYYHLTVDNDVVTARLFTGEAMVAVDESMFSVVTWSKVE